MGIVNNNIRKFRTFRGMSQQELAQKVSRATNVISNWENGVHSPDLDTVVLICKALNVTPNEMFGWEDNEEYKDWVLEIEQLERERSDAMNRLKLYEAKLRHLKRGLDNGDR